MKSKTTLIYGFVVCVVSVITFIIACGNLVSSLTNQADLLHSAYDTDPSLASFETYKVGALKSITKDAAYIPNDSILQVMYKDSVDDVMARNNHRIWSNIVVNSVLIIVSIVLFLIHWIWIVRTNR